MPPTTQDDKIMREAVLLGGILTSSEVWVGLNNSHNEILENLDERLLRGIVQCHSKTARVFLYQETSALPIRFVIKYRRLAYLRHILTRDKGELISKVFFAQQRKPVKKVWALTVKKDLEDINIGLSLEAIKNMKKEQFKKLLKEKVSNTVCFRIFRK